MTARIPARFVPSTPFERRLWTNEEFIRYVDAELRTMEAVANAAQYTAFERGEREWF